ncbi:hypothetical protein ACLOJK_028581 [Asimina triloba]
MMYSAKNDQNIEDEEEEDDVVVGSHGKRAALTSVNSKASLVPPEKSKENGPMDMFCTLDPSKVLEKGKAENG